MYTSPSTRVVKEIGWWPDTAAISITTCLYASLFSSRLVWYGLSLSYTHGEVGVYLWCSGSPNGEDHDGERQLHFNGCECLELHRKWLVSTRTQYYPLFTDAPIMRTFQEIFCKDHSIDISQQNWINMLISLGSSGLYIPSSWFCGLIQIRHRDLNSSFEHQIRRKIGRCMRFKVANASPL